MTIELLTKLVAVLVPLGTTVAAFIAAYASRTSARASRISASVAESQRELAERQYELQRRHQELEELRAKRELYERRLSVYQAVKVLLYNFDGLGGVSNQDANTFSQNTAEADF